MGISLIGMFWTREWFGVKDVRPSAKSDDPGLSRCVLDMVHPDSIAQYRIISFLSRGKRYEARLRAPSAGEKILTSD